MIVQLIPSNSVIIESFGSGGLAPWNLRFEGSGPGVQSGLDPGCISGPFGLLLPEFAICDLRNTNTFQQQTQDSRLQRGQQRAAVGSSSVVRCLKRCSGAPVVFTSSTIILELVEGGLIEIRLHHQISHLVFETVRMRMQQTDSTDHRRTHEECVLAQRVGSEYLLCSWK